MLAETTIYVPSNSNDANGGPLTKPFVSFGRAVAKAYKLSGELNINVLEGTYFLSQSVVLTADDYCKESETLTIKN